MCRTYFPEYPIINRGFGGSGLKDAIEYEDDIIAPYHPKQVVIYSGENDIAVNISANEVLQRFTTLFNMIRRDLPDASVVYISIKPSPSRQKFMPVMESAECNDQKVFIGKEEYNFCRCVSQDARRFG
jgi:hypothetical protein